MRIVLRSNCCSLTSQHGSDSWKPVSGYHIKDWLVSSGQTHPTESRTRVQSLSPSQAFRLGCGWGPSQRKCRGALCRLTWIAPVVRAVRARFVAVREFSCSRPRGKASFPLGRGIDIVPSDINKPINFCDISREFSHHTLLSVFNDLFGVSKDYTQDGHPTFSSTCLSGRRSSKQWRLPDGDCLYVTGIPLS